MHADERNRLEQELLELHFDCHPDPEPLRERLQREPELQRIQRDALRTAGILSEAARDPLPELDSPLPVERTPRGRRFDWRTRRVRLVSASLAAALVVAGFVLHWAVCAWQQSRLSQRGVHIVVEAPSAVPDGAPLGFVVHARDPAGEPADAEVAWVAYDRDGEILGRSEAPIHGTLTVTLPTRLLGARRLEVTADTASGVQRASFEFEPSANAPLVWVGTDKPIYRPGEAVFVRCVVLDRVSLAPLRGAGLRELRLLDALGNAVESTTLALDQLEHGAFGHSFALAEDAAGGRYTVELREPGGHAPAEVSEFVVRRFQAPRLGKQLTLDRPSYAPGSAGSAELAVVRLGEGPAAGANVSAALIVDGNETWREDGRLDGAGRLRLSFAVPSEVARGAGRLVATITDGGVVETVVEPFVVPTGKVEVELFPEGGALVPRAKGRVYAEVRDALGRPIDARGRVVDGGGREVARFATEHQGRGRFELTPEAGVEYRLELVEPAVSSHALPVAEAGGVMLRALADRYGPGEPLRVRVHGDAPLTLAAFCRGALVGQARVDSAGAHDVEIPLGGEAFGVLRLTAFDASLRPVAERLVQRLPARSLAVAIDAGQATLAPGERQTLRLVARDESGRAAAGAVLGVTVSDDAVWQLDGEARVGLAEHALLFGDVEALEERATFLSTAADAATHVDLLLGTRGWRRFVWRGDEDARARAEQIGERALALVQKSGHNATPRVYDGAGQQQAAVAAAAEETRGSRERATEVGFIALVVLLVWLTAEGAIALARRVRLHRHWLGDIAFGGLGAVAALLVAYVGILALVRSDSVLLPPMAREVAALGGEAGQVWFADRLFQGGAIPPDAARFDFDELELHLGGGIVLGDHVIDQLEEADRRDDAPNAAGEPVPEQALTADREQDAGFALLAPSPVVREYAHRARGGRERRDFTETLCWYPLLVTDAEGRAEVGFDTSDKVTTWRIDVDAHAAGRLGGGHATFDTRLPFFLEAKLPVETTVGDELLLPVALIAQQKHAVARHAEVRVRLDGGIASNAGAHHQVELLEGRGRLLVPARVEATGDAAIELAGAFDRFTDITRQSIRVVPSGFPHRRDHAGKLTVATPATIDVALPERAAPGSLRARLVVYPSPLATIREGLDGILQQPSGCFEQASSSNYPNVLVLSYLEASGDDLPVVSARARELMPQGYRLIAGYECSDRGYEWFGSNPGHEALTAYGLMEFADMGKVFDVDAGMVARTRTWLLGRRDGNGGYQRDPKALDSFGRAPQHVTDAYVTYALLYAGEPADTMAREVDRLAERALATDDGYELALCAGGLAIAGRADAARNARERLQRMQEPDGRVPGRTTSITSSGGDDLAVEATSLAVLAWLHDADAFAAPVRKALDFVLSRQSGRGTFGATQATILALRALTEHARNSRVLPVGGRLRVRVVDPQSGESPVVAEHAFVAGQADAIVIDLLPHLVPGATRRVVVELDIDGDAGARDAAALPWTCEVAYHGDQPADDADAKVAVRTALRADRVREGDTIALDVTVSNRSADGLPMTLAIVGLPAGLEAPTAVLDDLKASGAIDLWEVRGREVVFYWRGMAPEQRRDLQLDLEARIPGTTTGPASRAYLYYTPDAVRWAAPLRVTVEAAR